ncbi:unnamed protein product, partial [Symbiodinium sp. KB8]
MATPVLDINSSISNLLFVDQDLDEDELGGDILWLEPTDVRRVLGYRVYLSTGLRAGQPRSLIGSEIAAGTTQTFLPAESSMQTWTHIAVFTRSQLVEQTTPAGASISDTSSVSTIDFRDDDLDELEIGGVLFWKNGSDFTEATHYEVYLAEDRNGTNRSYLGNISDGASFDVPADTALEAFSHLVVYARSELVEQSTPAAARRIVDTVASVSAVSFVDLDLDEDELGGHLLWQEPSSTERVEFYVVYLALDSVGTGRSLAAGGEMLVGTQRTTLPADTSISSFNHFLVYTKSALAEQSTPVGVALYDSTAFVGNLSFADKDLDVTELGGNITWFPPADDRLVLGYNIFFADDAVCQDMACQKLLLESVAANESLVIVPPDTQILNFTHVLVYATSGFSEQTTPASHQILDANASVSSIRLVDKDLESEDQEGL